MPPTGDLACNPGMCPDWELKWWPFVSQASTQPLSHTSQGGLYLFFKKYTQNLKDALLYNSWTLYFLLYYIPNVINPNLEKMFWTRIYNAFFKIYFLIFRERGREKETEGDNHQCERETLTGCLPYVPRPGTEPATQACALTKNPASDLLFHWMTPNQLSHTGWGGSTTLLLKK